MCDPIYIDKVGYSYMSKVTKKAIKVSRPLSSTGRIGGSSYRLVLPARSLAVKSLPQPKVTVKRVASPTLSGSKKSGSAKTK